MENIIQNFINNQIQESYSVKKIILNDQKLTALILKVSEICLEVYKNGNKTIIAGNGGSAADSQHLAGEFVSRFAFDRPGLPSIALTTDTSVLTAIGNDYGYKKLFERQIQANGKKGDMFIGISTSGNSENIIEAIKQAKKMEIITVGLTGENESKMDELCDYCIKVPSKETPRIQESHIMIGHIICAVVERAYFKREF